MLKSEKLNSLLSCDTEDNSKGKVYWVVFFDGKTFYNFKTPPEAIKFLDTIETKVTIYCTNLEYDIANIFWGNLHLLNMSWGARLISAKYKKITFLDTLNSWFLGVAAMGEYLGKPKHGFNPKSLTYCQRDTEITYDFVMAMKRRYDKIGLKIKSTIAQTAITFWKDSFYNGKIHKVPEGLIEFLKPAYYGGRVECYFIGELNNMINHADVKSMYPSVMQKAYPYPFKWLDKVDINCEGITYCKVESNLKLPFLPFRDKESKKLFFPNGKFKGAWSNVELRYFIKQGGKILKTYDGIIYPKKCYPFKSYVRFLFDKRAKAKDELMKYIFKILMNSLYGKFAQNNERTVIINTEKWDKLKLSEIPDTFKEFEGLFIFKQIGKYPYYSNYIWSIYTTAYARIKLYDYLKKCYNESDLLYCDTDSLIWRGDKNLFKYGSKLGDLEFIKTYDNVTIKGNKFYKLDDKIKCKGIPKDSMANYFDLGKAMYKKPLKIKEAIRRGMIPNYWIDIEKVERIIYNKRKILKSGFTEALNIKA